MEKQETETEQRPSEEQNAAVALPDDVNISRATMMEPSNSLKSKSSWFTPLRVLVIFCVISLINYLDRGVIASNGVNGRRQTCTKSGKCTPGRGIQGEFKLNNFEDGVLSSAFMVGLLVASPIFASLAKSLNPFRLIGVGLSVWTLAVVGCGGSLNFWSIAVCRMFVGIGEASFVSLAAPFIDDNAPAAQKGRWISIFYMTIPVGFALGYVYGGLVGSHVSWRYAFFGEAILMLPFAVLGFIVKPLKLKGFTQSEPKNASTYGGKLDHQTEVGEGGVVAGNDEMNDHGLEKTSLSKDEIKPPNLFSRFWKDMKMLLCNKVYAVNVLGYVTYTFVIGAYSYWGPKAGYSVYDMGNADMVFGGMTVVCGIIGTIAGGSVLDWLNLTISNSFKLLSGATFLGAVSCFSAICLRNLYGFIALFSAGNILLYAAQGPVNFVCLRSVGPSLRPLSMAMSTVAIHIFGDVPSSPLVGVLQDHINNWRKTVLILTAIFFLAAAIWFIGIFLRGVDKLSEDNELEATAVNSSNLNTLPEEQPKVTEMTKTAEA